MSRVGLDIMEQSVQEMAWPSRNQFRLLTKAQLVQLAVEQEVEMPEGILKPALAKLLISTLALDEWWAEQEQREERERQERREDKERESRERLAQLEVDRVRASQRAAPTEPRFDVRSAISLMPKFSEEDVDTFFDAFEVVARECDWPETKWPLLVQSVLKGKAQVAFAALDPRMGLEYDALKTAVLAAYGGVPEAYRQRFRTVKRKDGESYLDLSRKIGVAGERWLKSTETYDFAQLRELLLLEQFKNTVPRAIEIYLSEQKVATLLEAAHAADAYEVIHRGPGGVARTDGRGADPGRSRESSSRGSPPGGKVDGAQRPGVEKARVDVVCHFCGERGHIKPRCPRFKRDGDIICQGCKRPGHVRSQCPQRPPFESRAKAVALVAALTQGNEGGSAGPKEELPSSYQPFTSMGTVSVVPGGEEVPVTILRDTGAAQSLLLTGVVELPSEVSSRSALVKGLGGQYECVPLHVVHLKSNVVTGPVTVGVVSTLPVQGIGLLLGNDLAGSQVCVMPVVDSTPLEVSETQELEQQHPEVFTACVVTRARARAREAEAQAVEALSVPDEGASGASDVGVEGEPIDLADTVFTRAVSKGVVSGEEGPELPLSSAVDAACLSREALIQEQHQDPSLAPLWRRAGTVEDSKGVAVAEFVDQGILMRKWRPSDRPADEDWWVQVQIVAPSGFRGEILRLAHETPLAGHLGVKKTLARVLKQFYWPTVRRDVLNFCRSCHACQIAGKAGHFLPVAPLQPAPVVEAPFSRVIIDCVGPLPRTKKGNVYLLTLMDVATRFPEAVPVRNIRAPVVIEALLQFFSRVGLPREVQSDRGTNFTSGVFQNVMCELGITQVLSSAYHPESQGALERCHQTLKSMVRTFCVDCPKDWDVAMPFLLFAIRDAVNESTGFSPFELVYGHEVRSPLTMMRERLLEPQAQGDLLQYVSTFRDRLKAAWKVAAQNLTGAKERMKARYDRKAVQRSFVPGDKVLVLMPVGGEKFGTRFNGPFTVVRKVGACNYVISTPERRQKTRLCHINLLKLYVERDSASPVACVVVAATEDEKEEEWFSPEPVAARLQNSRAREQLCEQLRHLTPDQVQDVVDLVAAHPSVVRDRPGLTSLVEHDVDTGQVAPIKQHPYRLPPARKEKVREEVEYMLGIGAIEPGSSEWSSPVVLIPKNDGTQRFCIDYRKVNAVTKTDAYPIPRLEDCIDRIGQARFVTKLDLLKGYWQVPLSERAQEVSAFVTHDALYRCRVLPFGMKNAPATFQRLMNLVTVGLDHVVTYIDDVVVYSGTWQSHLGHLRELFGRLESAQLVINLPKCEFAQSQVTYLGHQVGCGAVLPRLAKVQAIVELPAPTTRRQLMRVLGMCGFYRRFVHNFAAVVAPLTALLAKGAKWAWTQDCQDALDQVKAILACAPVLKAPDFERPFALAVDACDVGVGAVLLQVDEAGVERPVAYYSKKLNRHQRAYSTVEKEALALVLAVKHFEVYVSSVGGPVTIYSDHNPLTFLAKFQVTNARVFRWSLILQPYSLVVRHLAGKDNVVADALSRL